MDAGGGARSGAARHAALAFQVPGRKGRVQRGDRSSGRHALTTEPASGRVVLVLVDPATAVSVSPVTGSRRPSPESSGVAPAALVLERGPLRKSEGKRRSGLSSRKRKVPAARTSL